MFGHIRDQQKNKSGDYKTQRKKVMENSVEILNELDRQETTYIGLYLGSQVKPKSLTRKKNM